MPYSPSESESDVAEFHSAIRVVDLSGRGQHTLVASNRQSPLSAGEVSRIETARIDACAEWCLLLVPAAMSGRDLRERNKLQYKSVEKICRRIS
jgi:hypothetical protein